MIGKPNAYGYRLGHLSTLAIRENVGFGEIGGGGVRGGGVLEGAGRRCRCLLRADGKFPI